MPVRCKTVQELWARLPAWERLGEEVVLSGFAVPPWIASSALDQLLPTQLRDALVPRASHGDELKAYAQRLAWVKTQMEYSRGQAQATAYAPGGHGKDASGDVNMYSVDEPDDAPDAIEAMTWALAEASHAGQWELAETLTASISALKGGKGGFRKGFGKGNSGGKGAASPAAAGDAAPLPPELPLPKPLRKPPLPPFSAEMEAVRVSASSHWPAWDASARAHVMASMASGASSGSSTEYILTSPEASLPWPPGA